MRNSRIKFLGHVAPPKVLFNPGSEALAAPNLLVPEKKPVGPVKIDWTHPLTQGLIVCMLDPVVNLANDRPNTFGLVRPDVYARQGNLGFASNTSSVTDQSVRFYAPELNSQGGWSIHQKAYWGGSINGDKCLSHVDGGYIEGVYNKTIKINIPGFGSVGATTWNPLNMINYLFNKETSIGKLRTYVSGELIHDGSWAVDIGYAAGEWKLGGAGTRTDVDFWFERLYMWDIELDQGRRDMLFSDPYQFLIPA